MQGNTPESILKSGKVLSVKWGAWMNTNWGAESKLRGWTQTEMMTQNGDAESKLKCQI